MADEDNNSTADESEGENKPKRKVARNLAEFKYVGDDGGRWLFLRRSDGLAITIDKPKGLLDVHTPRMAVELKVRGKHFNDDILGIVRK